MVTELLLQERFPSAVAVALITSEDVPVRVILSKKYLSAVWEFIAFITICSVAPFKALDVTLTDPGVFVVEPIPL